MITVNIISYKYGHLAAQAIESVLSQTAPPAIIRLYDDGVGDCGHLRKIYPTVEIIERAENMGIVRSLNDALERTTTPRCMMLGADNYLRPDALALMGARSASIVSTNIALFGEGAEPFCKLVGATTGECGFPVWRFERGNIEVANYIHGSSLYDTLRARRAGGYRASGRKNSEEDWMLWRALLGLGAVHEHVAEPLLFYRRHKLNFQQTT